MDVTLLSGVVRNRRMAGAVSRVNFSANDGTESPHVPNTITEKAWDYLSKNAICRKFKLRVHKFSFQWDLLLHLSICIGSLTPFFFTGKREYTWLPLLVWAFYNILVIIGPRYANSVIPGFGKLQHSFKATIEDFFSPKLLPVLSISFLLVALSLIVTGHRLGGPPLCYQTCGQCLAQWSEGVIVSKIVKSAVAKDALSIAQDFTDNYRIGCGYANGKELLAYYTMAQISFLLFLTVCLAMAVCLGWTVAVEEIEEFSDAEAWLKKQDLRAFELRNELIKQFGRPASSIRPEGSATWVFYGVTAALSFTLLGWHNWYVLPPSPTATLLIVLNLLTILMTLLILHLGFFGRLLALYKRNFLRVEYLTMLLSSLTEKDIDYWWNCRNFVLNDDLSLDYDIGGLAVSVTFLINLLLFVTFVSQMYREGFNKAVLESPGSYCAYACMYLTSCLIKLFTLATKTYEEQHQHAAALQKMSIALYYRTGGADGDNTPLAHGSGSLLHDQALNWVVSEEDYSHLRDDGPIDIDSDFSASEKGEDHNLADESHSLLGPAPHTPRGGKSSHHKSIIAGANSPRQSSAGNKKPAVQFSFMEKIASNSVALTKSILSAATGGNVPRQQASDNGNINNNVGGGLGLLNPAFNKSTSNAHLGKLAVTTGSDLEAAGDIESALQGDTPNSPHSPYSPKSNDLRSGSGSPGGNSVNPPSNGSPVSPAAKQQSSTGHGNSGTNNVQLPRPLNIAVPPPPLVRAASNGFNSAETYRQSIAEIMSQIRKYDPYPCILGIPIMPHWFAPFKFYLFMCFAVTGCNAMALCLRQITGGDAGGVSI